MLISRSSRLFIYCVVFSLLLRAESRSDGAPEPKPAKAESAALDIEIEATLRAVLQHAQELQAKLEKLNQERESLEQEAARLRILRQHLQPSPAATAAPGVLVASAAAPAPSGLILPVAHPPDGKDAPGKLNPDSSLEAPLSFRIGAAEFTPGGFVDFVTAFRSTNVGSGLATAFATIPFSNTAAGKLSEVRLSGQASRLSMKMTSHPGNYSVTGYVEADFLGTTPGNAYVTSNSYTLRMRLFYGDIERGKWEMGVGQAWSLLTPNRVGLSFAPGDVGLPVVADPNYQVGFVWARNPQARLIYHANDHWALGASLENPNQFTGSGVVLPSAFPASEVDNGSNLTSPALRPDVIAKMAYDTKLAGHAFHVELAGLLTSFRIVNPINSFRSTKTGSGIALNLRLEPVRRLRLIGSSFWSDGGGRYAAGLGPSVVVRQDMTLSPVHSASLMGGIEYQLTPHWMAYSYYGIVYFERDLDGSGQTVVGYGAPNSGGNANRTIQQATGGLTRVFWKSPALGALQLNLQYSHLLRAAWWAPTGSPDSARAHMVMTELRYVLP